MDLCYDAMMSEIDNGKMRVFPSDVMFDVERDGRGGRVSIPFGRQDCTVFRKVMSTEDTIHEFAPTLRTEAQARAFRVALQTLGDLCGFGINYFDLENVGYVKTATEVSADSSALMRNIRRHERAIAGICRALMAAERRLGVGLPDEGLVRVTSTTASSRTRRPRSARTWTRSRRDCWSRGSTAPSGAARTRRPRGQPPDRGHPPPGWGDASAGSGRPERCSSPAAAAECAPQRGADGAAGRTEPGAMRGRSRLE